MTSPTFQSIILTLQEYWAARGCMIWQPYYTQVGAGTMNPATFLRVLGPEPWNVAYVEPSIRPDDGRYGENPNRFQQHYQFQVILKPDPGDPMETYLQSLAALGLDRRQHDIRFVEDNWESPALGAWGLGWEVWADGQEITQFTYFQQAGGLPCDPVSVEITYGLERILIALRNAGAIWDEPWSEGVTYGETNRQGEYEHSKYYFEVAGVDRLRQMYDLLEAESRAALAAGLVLPAYDYLLRCSHTFNVLDTRGAVGVTERAAFFGKMRTLARDVAQAYLDQRQRLEYPLLKGTSNFKLQTSNSKLQTSNFKLQTSNSKLQTSNSKLQTSNSKLQTPNFKLQTSNFELRAPDPPSAFRFPASPAPFVLEIGVEELPAGDLDSARAQLRELLPAFLADLRLEHGPVTVFGTPRRLTVLVEALSPARPDREVVHRGPPAARAFEPSGAPTRAAEGFARSKGVAVADLQVRDVEGGQYAVAVVAEKGRPAAEALAEKLPDLLAALKFERAMRWNASGVAFSRPIRWLVALHGEAVVPFEYAGVAAGRVSRGLRPLGSPEIAIREAATYREQMEKAGVVLEAAARRERIRQQAAALAAEVGGSIPDDPELLAEVAHLAESPTAFRGAFEAGHLDLPHAVLVSVMKKHQRYFPVERDGRLLPYFVGVRNGDAQGLDLVIEGNEHVIRARFADADFFIREDVKQPLQAHRARLGTLTFQVKLGSMLDKTERIERLTAALAPMLGLTDAETAAALRAAHLCKADLATQMVVEMTSLQGVMGRVYALRSGEPEEVARAIYEHYFPVGVRPAPPGLAVGLADRLDSLVGLFAVGLAPTGAKDPFALRRAALGLAQTLLALGVSFDLRAGLAEAARVQPAPVSEAVLAECDDYLRGRLRGILIEAGHRYDVVDAALAERGHNPVRARQAAAELSAWVAKPDWPPTLAAFSRCVRITREFRQTFPLDPAALTDPAERALYAAYQQVAAAVQAVQSVDQFFVAFTPIIPVVSKFFDDVLVMAEDAAVRENRLALLQRIAALTKGMVDLSQVEGF